MKELFNKDKTLLSFEVFPPKKEEEFANAYSVLDRLSALNPDFISCTYGAGGSRSKSTVEIASYIQNTLHIPALAHITCVGNKKEDIDAVLDQMKAAGIKNVLPLRGDRPQYMTDEQFESRHFEHGSDLMNYIHSITDFDMAGACYPEKHYEATTLDEDIKNLLHKQEAGASVLITQLCFDNEFFYRFEEKVRKAGITLPICFGVMPITSANQLGRTVSLSGSYVPKKLADIIATYGDHPDDMRKAGIEYAVHQLNDLRAHKVDGTHIYSMNKPKTTAEIVSALV